MCREFAGKYVLLHLKSRGVLYFLYGSIISIPLFIAAVYYDLGKRDILLSIAAGYGLAFLIQCLGIVRFFSMIRRQEQQFGISFSDCDAKPIWKNGSGFLTDDWFILAGYGAFYRGYIKRMTWQYERPYRSAGRYYLIIQTTDRRRYRLPLDENSSCARVHRWWKENNQISEEFYGL